MISPKYLLNIDRLFYPIYRFWGVINIFLRRSKSPYTTHDYVIIKMMGIGSITRIITTLKHQQVDLKKIHFITFSINKELCEILEIPNVFFIDSSSLSRTLIDLVKVAFHIRGLKPRYLVDFERSSNILGAFRSLVTLFSKIGIVSFYKVPQDRKSSLNIQFSLGNRSIYELILLSLTYLPKSQHSQEEKTSPQNQSGNILININASNYLKHRKYALDNFAKVISGLLKKDPNFNINLIGSPAEKAYVQTLIDKYFSGVQNIFNCCDKWSLKELVKKFESTQLLITNDSGPMHLAVMKNVQTVVIWGPTIPATFGYTNQPNVVNIQSHRACAPCFTYPKSKAAIACNGSIDCMKDIKPETILNEAIKLLTRKQETAWT